MVWKQTGRPSIQKHRDKWVVRVEGVDTHTGRRRPKQVGTYTSKRAAQTAAMAFVAAGESVTGRDTVAGLVDRWIASKVDVGNKTRLQYEWAAGHIRDGFGGVRVDQLDRATTEAAGVHRQRQPQQARVTQRGHCLVREPGLPVLLASGYSEEIVGSTGGEFEIVRKPYDLSGIESALAEALEQARTADA